jgi:anti-sigma factor RsiW
MSSWPPPVPPGHLDDLLSAYLDGELTPAERVEVDAHLAGCPRCRDDLDGEREVRQVIRALPAVDAPFGFYERILRDGPGAGAAPPPAKRRIRFGLANLVATAAAWVLVLGVANLGSGGGSVEPEPNGYVAAHASVLPSFVGSGGTSQETAKRYDVPDRLAGTYELAGVQEEGGIPQLVYTDGERTVSMFLRPGHVNVDALPANAHQVRVNGFPAWQVPSPDGDVIFLQRPGVVVVIVGPAPNEAASDVATAPGPSADDDDSLLGRARRAAEGLLETFGLSG